MKKYGSVSSVIEGLKTLKGCAIKKPIQYRSTLIEKILMNKINDKFFYESG